MKTKKDESLLSAVLSDSGPVVKRVVFFSFMVSLLMLAPSVYMLEVYDRVVNSQNHMTLLMLTVLVVGAYLFLEMIEWVRTLMLSDTGMNVHRTYRERAFHAAYTARFQGLLDMASQPLKDLKTVCDFIPSRAFLSMIDVPFAVIFLVTVFLIKPTLGWFAVAGAIAQAGLGVMNERRIHEPLKNANMKAASTNFFASNMIRKAQVVESMGMALPLYERWLSRHASYIDDQKVASEHAGFNASLSRVVQLLTSSLLLGLGAWFAIRGELGGGLMIVASILGGRVLAPLVQLIGSWRQVVEVRDAYGRLQNLLKSFPEPQRGMPLPPPAGRVSVESIIAGPPQGKVQILKGISFQLSPGRALGVIGPSASGKTTLARVLVGVWPSMSGKVRLDGSDIYTWNKSEVGPYIGYLPQNAELFEGSIAENIARFGSVDEDKVMAACTLVGLKEFVDALPLGVHTPIGSDGHLLSGGQKQRVALARAVYGLPRLVVLDEPNSNLDEQGDAALLKAIMELKVKGSTVIVNTHRKNLLSVMDDVLVLMQGQMKLFGPTQEVLSRLQSPPTAQTAANGMAVMQKAR